MILNKESISNQKIRGIFTENFNFKFHFMKFDRVENLVDN